MFSHLTPHTRNRIADHLVHGGRPLKGIDANVARRALKATNQDNVKAAALLRGELSGRA